jgi:excisionase family DNA binding protein
MTRRSGPAPAAGTLCLVSTGPRTSLPVLLARRVPSRKGSAVSTGAEWPPEIPVRLAYSVEEAAALLGIGRTFMFQLVATGEIESFKIGNLRKISHEALIAYINRLRSEQAAAVSRWGKTRGSGQQDGSQA